MADDNEQRRIKVSNIAAPPTDPESYLAGRGRATAEDIARAQQMGIDTSKLGQDNIKVIPNAAGTGRANNIAMPAATQVAQNNTPPNAVLMKDTSQLRGSARNEAMGFPGDLEVIKGNVFTMGPRAGNDAEIEHSKRNQAVMDAFYRAQTPESPTYEYRWNHIPGDVTGSGRNLTHRAGFDTLERVLINPGQTQAQASQAALSHIGQALHGVGTLEGVANTQANTNKTDAETANIPEHERNLARYYEGMNEKNNSALNQLISDAINDVPGAMDKLTKMQKILSGEGSDNTHHPLSRGGGGGSSEPEAPQSKVAMPTDTSANDTIESMKAKGIAKRERYIQNTLNGFYDRFQPESPTAFAGRAIKNIGSGIASLFHNPEDDQWQ